jgi:hypothetical protein
VKEEVKIVDVQSEAEVARLVVQCVKAEDGVCAVPLGVVVEGLLRGAIASSGKGRGRCTTLL